MKKSITFTLPVAPVTKKNSMQMVYNRKTGKPFPVQSKAYKAYEKAAGAYLQRLGYMATALTPPLNVKGVFYMPTRRRVDLVNLEEALCDVLVKFGVLEDDNSKIVAAMDGSRVSYDKENPRTEVTIEEL